MKKNTLYLFVLILLVKLNLKGQCSFTTSILPSGPTSFCSGGSVNLAVSTSVTTWTQKSDFAGSARAIGVSFSIGTKAYLGLGSASNTFSDLWEYTPSTDSWVQKANFPGPLRYQPAYFTVGNKGYVCGGSAGFGSVLTDLWEYDPATNSWTQKANFPGMGRFASTGIGIGTKGYIGLGQDVNYNYLNDFWEYDPATNTWAQKANFGGSARSGAVAFTLGGNCYMGTGLTSSSLMNDIWEYNPSSNTWAQKANYGAGAVMDAVAFTINNKGYIATGAGNTTSTDYALWYYDATLNTWTQKENFPGPTRRYAISMTVSGKAYIATGQNNLTQSSLNDVWEYDPAASITYSWSNGPATPSITVSSTGTYVVILTNALNCTATAVQTVTVIDPPAIGLNFPVICPGQTANVNAIGASTFTWSTGFVGTSISVSPSVTTDYTVTATNSSGCTGFAVSTVSVHPLPDISTTLIQETISANLTGASYQWVECTGSSPAYLNIAGQTNQTFTASANGSYAVIITNQLGCIDTSACVTILSTHLTELSLSQPLMIYPNPSKDNATVDVKQADIYELKNSFGQLIKTIELREGKQSILLTDLAPGVYYLTHKASSTKLILTR